jgi:hypothetical protein
MNEQLQQIAADTGVPSDLLARAAEARAKAAGSSPEAIVAGWAGVAPAGSGEPEAAAVPVADSISPSPPVSDAPADEESPVGEESPAAAGSSAGAGAGRLPEALLRRSAAAKAKREGRPLDEVLAEMGLEPESAEPGAPRGAEEQPTAPAAASVAAAPPPEPEEEADQEPTPVFAGFPRWLAASFIIIPMIAVLYAALAPSGPDCGASGQLSINPINGEAESCGGGVSPFYTLGQSIYTERCVACHSADGSGGVGPAFAGGAVLITFPDCPDQIDWVTIGSAAWPSPTYGATNKPVAGSGSPMPSFGSVLTADEIAAVVLYERVAFGGQDVTEAETTCGLVEASG